jgi:hypothetical protein
MLGRETAWILGDHAASLKTCRYTQNKLQLKSDLLPFGLPYQGTVHHCSNVSCVAGLVHVVTPILRYIVSILRVLYHAKETFYG